MAVLISTPSVNVNGDFESPPFRMPNRVSQHEVVIVRPVIDLADLISNARLDFGFYAQNEQTGEWGHVASARWQGPSNPSNPDTIPSLWISTAQLEGKLLAVRANSDRQIRVGLEVETVG